MSDEPEVVDPLVLQRQLAVQHRRLATAAAVVRCVQALAPIMDNANDVYQEYWDVRNDGGDFTDEELGVMGILNTDLLSAVTTIENFTKFVGGETFTANIHRVPINKMRRVGAQI